MTAPKWKISIASQIYYTVEVEAENVQRAVDQAVREIKKDPSHFITGDCTIVTSVAINDREAKEYHQYIPEIYPLDCHKSKVNFIAKPPHN